MHQDIINCILSLFFLPQANAGQQVFKLSHRDTEGSIVEIGRHSETAPAVDGEPRRTERISKGSYELRCEDTITNDFKESMRYTQTLSLKTPNCSSSHMHLGYQAN